MSDHHCPHCGFQLGQHAPITFGNVTIEPPGKILLCSRDVELGPSQFLVADALIRARGKGVYRSTLASLIDSDIDDRSVTVYIKRLRETFRRHDPTFNQIQCLKGFGAYRWVEAPRVSAEAMG